MPIEITKEAISKGDENLHCVLCSYGKKAGRILWRIEFVSETYRFHWLLCNRCRFNLFVALGGKRMETLVAGESMSVGNIIPIVQRLVKEPKQKISRKGKVRSSYFYSLSHDRRAAIEAGFTLQFYEQNYKDFDFKTGKAVYKGKKKKNKDKGKKKPRRLL